MDNLFNSLEIEVFKLSLSGDNQILSRLRQQFESATFVSRTMTGVGFYTDIAVNKDLPPIQTLFNIKQRFVIGDVEAFVGQERLYVGFVIFVDNGYLVQLECYTFGNDRLPDDYLDYELSYCEKDEKVRLSGLEESWKK